jgi:hypothetical protein
MAEIYIQNQSASVPYLNDTQVYLPDVTRYYRDKREKVRGVRNLTCGEVSNDRRWSCTADRGHPDYYPHMAGGGRTIFAVWYDDATIARYGDGRLPYGTDTDVQGVTFDGSARLPDFTAEDRPGTGRCNCVIPKPGGGRYQWVCTLGKGHLEYVPHLAGAGNAVIGIAYSPKTLKRFGLLPAGERYPAAS